MNSSIRRERNECEFCGAKNETDSCPKCKADFDASIRWFVDKYAKDYHVKQQQDNHY
jgi:hypothetical protein